VKRSRILTGIGALMLLCGCSSSSGSTTAPTATSSSNQSTCHASTDSVQLGVPLVEISPTGAPRPIRLTKKHTRLTCYTTLSAAQDGSATATFGSVTACVFSQLGSGVGTLITRYPKNMLFNLVEGKVTCTSNAAQGQEALVCGMGTVYLSAVPTNWDGTCGADGAFGVGVYEGSVQVDYPSGKATLHPFSQLAFDPETRSGKVSTGISFPAAEISIFDTLKP
jgi:hypothetical protein